MVISIESKRTDRPSETVRVLVEWRGLGRAFALAPDSVIGAVERGRRIAAFPDTYTPLTELASRFSADPETDANEGA